ncbi:excalibur calcium-binding domain-containing protein [Maliponia aquimaris]|uniref:Excalibur calcium-binding domain-containing protein n=1 Tax=Maliponia aquimaris TaxID=1673631 RepID=A0A238KQ37_9RHOB|nr:excalibur calcium-binding domain-containing protein [Maliponia aquimaris]SMX44905.1 hypothetical protein MAA8898_03089 [Maliponia aquimaris]
MTRFVLGLALAGVLASTGFAQEQPSPRERLDAFRTVQAFDCRDVSCKKLRSCEEACFKLIQCGQRKRDADNDGIPCENLCSRRC